MKFVRAARAEIEDIFRELDANGDGSISQIEFIKGLRKNPILAQKLEMPSVIHQESESRTLFQQAFHEIDVDESKTISQDEFLAFYRPLSALPSGSWKAYDWRPEDHPHPAQQMHTEQEPFVREDTYEQPPSQAVPQAGVPHATSQREQPQPQDQYVPFHPATENSHVEHPQAEEQKLPSEYGDNRHAVARYLQADDLPPLPKVGNTPSYLPENMQVQIPAPSPGFKPNANSVPPAGFEKVQDSFPEIKKGPDIKMQRNAPIPLAPKSSGLNPGLEANRMSSSPSINLRSQAPTLLTRGASQAHQSNSSNLPISTEQLRHKLISFYARVCPARLDKVASFVSHFEGRLINAQEIIDLNTELLETYGYDLNSYVYINYDAEILSDVISTSRQSWPPLRSPQTLPSMSHVRQSPTISARQQMEWSMSPEMVTVPIPGMSHRGMSSPSPGPRYSASSFSMPSFVHPAMSVPSISFPKRSSSPGFISARDFEDIPTASTNPSTFREWEFGGLPSQSSTFREGPVIMSPRSLEAPLFRSTKVQSSTETNIIPASQSSSQFADSHPAEDPVPILPPPQPRSQRLQRSIPGFSPKAVVSTPDMAMVKVASPALQHVPGTTPPVQEETSAIAVPAPPQPELEDAAKPMMLEAPPPQQTSKLRGAIGKVMQGNRAAKMFNEGKHGEAWATRMMAEEEQMLADEEPKQIDAAEPMMLEAPPPQQTSKLRGAIGKVMQGNRAAKMFNEGKHGEAWATRMMAEEEQMLADEEPKQIDAAEPMMLEAPPPQQTSKLRGAIGKVMQGNRAAKMFNEGKHGEAWATRMMAEEEQMLADEEPKQIDAAEPMMLEAPPPQQTSKLRGAIGKVMQGNRAAKMFNEGKHGEAWATRMMAEEEQMLADEEPKQIDAAEPMMLGAPPPQQTSKLRGAIGKVMQGNRAAKMFNEGKHGEAWATRMMLEEEQMLADEEPKQIDAAEPMMLGAPPRSKPASCEEQSAR